MDRLFFLAVAALLAGGCARQPVANAPSIPAAPSSTTPTPTSSSPVPASFTLPLDRAAERMTKKTFGTQVSPNSSPVQPERFSGYHTGVDFELLPGEAEGGESVAAVCAGQIIQASWVSGYGGVVVESCAYEGEPITVLYGHLRLTSMLVKPGQSIAIGQQLGVLGKGYTSETDSERTHLHLAVHRGTAVNLRGYVAAGADLAGWLDPAQVLGLPR